MKILFLCFFLLLSTQATAEMYRTVDKNGNVTFTDKPIGKNSKSYEPPPILTVPAGPAGTLPPLEKKKSATKYKSIAVTAPENDQTFFSDTTTIPVSISLSPDLDSAANHKLVFYVNGKVHGEGGSNYTLTDLPRGSYSLSAAVLNAKGGELIRSETVTIHIKRPHR